MNININYKIAIGLDPIDGPWGGGNQFVKNLYSFLNKNEIFTTFNLKDRDIDIILIIDPRKKKFPNNISINEALAYKKKINKNVKIIMRVNDCDERKKTNSVNKLFIQSSKSCDLIIFVSNWLKNLYISQGIEKSKCITIQSAANSSVFYPNYQKKTNKFKIITHHWSANTQKGFKLYKLLDKYLSINELKNNFEFTYLGNKPIFFFFKNSKYIKPKNSYQTSEILRSHDIYLTASLNEPAGMHFLEGLASGLPILYVDSGGTTELCKNYGISFNENNLIEKLFEMKSSYNIYQEKLQKQYFKRDNLMLSEYLKKFQEISK